jgi:hypothetical protein
MLALATLLVDIYTMEKGRTQTGHGRWWRPMVVADAADFGGQPQFYDDEDYRGFGFPLWSSSKPKREWIDVKLQIITTCHASSKRSINHRADFCPLCKEQSTMSFSRIIHKVILRQLCHKSRIRIPNVSDSAFSLAKTDAASFF